MMRVPDKDVSFAVAMALLVAIALAALFCDPHFRPPAESGGFRTSLVK
jgi:hypothetical protein